MRWLKHGCDQSMLIWSDLIWGIFNTKRKLLLFFLHLLYFFSFLKVSYLESQSIQHFSLLPLTWADVPLREVIVPGQYPLYLSGGGGCGRPQTPGCCGGGGRGCRAVSDPALKFPNHAALAAHTPARCARIHRLGQEDPPGPGAALHL